MDTRFLRDDFGMWETHHKPPSAGGLTPPIPGEIQTSASHCSKQTLEKWSCGPPQFLTWKTQDARLGPRTPSKYGRFQPLDLGLSENMCYPKNTCLAYKTGSLYTLLVVCYAIGRHASCLIHMLHQICQFDRHPAKCPILLVTSDYIPLYIYTSIISSLYPHDTSMTCMIHIPIVR